MTAPFIVHHRKGSDILTYYCRYIKLMPERIMSSCVQITVRTTVHIKDFLWRNLAALYVV